MRAPPQEVHRCFFKAFIEYASTVLFDRYVKAPISAEEVQDHQHEFELAGMHGCIGSTDATHIILEKVSYAQSQLHKGFKLGQTARTYNLTVNHRRRILSTTRGHPARWNDKTLILFDTFARGIQEGSLDECGFTLLERNNRGEVVSRRYRGVWLVVDNGYLSWPTTVPPFKISNDRRELRFSEWIESMRKDVECTFGILKGRWRILKTGIRLHGTANCDQIWCTCCALHNMLLDFDGLDVEWDGSAGQFDTIEMEEIFDRLPCSIRESLRDPVTAGHFDVSGMGIGESSVAANDDLDEDVEEARRIIEESEQEDEARFAGARALEDRYEEDGNMQRDVRRLSSQYFISKLVENFDICFQRNRITWPSR